VIKPKVPVADAGWEVAHAGDAFVLMEGTFLVAFVGFSGPFGPLAVSRAHHRRVGVPVPKPAVEGGALGEEGELLGARMILRTGPVRPTALRQARHGWPTGWSYGAPRQKLPSRTRETKGSTPPLDKAHDPGKSVCGMAFVLT
jgi:hypothetical protein